jgi:hypothetical protein
VDYHHHHQRLRHALRVQATKMIVGHVKQYYRRVLRGHWNGWKVKSVFVVHVGGTRCVTSSTDNIMKIQARITLTVEFIRGYIFLFLFDV